ncbi:UDP-glucose 4-epimerase [Rhodovulum sp. P5]|nr:UDP-glucose 4-epimerase [Rhodovulum sp. P5]
MKSVLVTGGAGYIGSHACKVLARSGYVPVTYDNLSTGWEQAVKFGPLEQGDIADKARLAEVFEAHNPVAVMHFAAFSQVGEAMREPGKYWRNNLCGSLALIEAAIAADCLNFVFSSTCAIFGEQDGVTLNEDSAQAPLNAYGASKRAIEDMLRDFGASHGLNSVIFRYFNVAGGDPDAEVGECHVPETHLIPIMLEAVDGNRPELTINGTDYNTPDGTCVRDYIHVMDLVEAHVLGVKWLEDGKGSRVFNLGSGNGYSVRQVLERGPRSPGWRCRSGKGRVGLAMPQASFPEAPAPSRNSAGSPSGPIWTR